MNLLPPAIIEALAGKIARSITPTLQASLKELASNVSHPPTKSFIQRLIPKSDTGQGGSQNAGRSSPTVTRLPPAASSQDKLAPAVIKQMVSIAQKRASVDQKQSGQSWWKRGWGTLNNGRKRSVASRAARLTVIAQKRLTAARSAVATSNKNRDQPGWHPAAHGALLAAQRAAAQKLAQATGLQSRATLSGASASGLVAKGLQYVASKIPSLAGPLALISKIPLAWGVALAGAKYLAGAPGRQIESLREGQRFSSRLLTAFAKYDTKTENLKALTARDTEGSTEFLINQQNKLRDNLRPSQSMFKNAINYTQGGLTAAANKFAEGWQLQFDMAAAADKVLKDALGGKATSPIDAFNQIREDRAKKQADDEKKQSQQFTDSFGSLAKGIIDPVKDARFNNVVKPALRPVR